MASNHAICDVLRVQPTLPTLAYHRHETRDHIHEDRAHVPDVQQHPRRRHLQEGLKDAPRNTVSTYTINKLILLKIQMCIERRKRQK